MACRKNSCLHPGISRRTAIQAGAVSILGLGMNHLDALRAVFVLMCLAFLVTIGSASLQGAGVIGPFGFMIMCGVGLYIPYVAFHTTIFERIISSSKLPGNLAFLMYLADSIGYLGYALVLAFNDTLRNQPEVLPLFRSTLMIFSVISIACLIVSSIDHYYTALGLGMATFPYLTYLRINFSAGERKRYSEIMGVKESAFDRVCQNIKDMVAIKKRDNLPVTIGMQMVLMPQDADQVIPLAKLGKKLRPDYAIIKHCTDNEDGGLGIDYKEYGKRKKSTIIPFVLQIAAVIGRTQNILVLAIKSQKINN